MSPSHLLIAELTLWKGTSSSSWLGRPDGVCILLSRQDHLSCHVFSPYDHGSLGHRHDAYVFGEYIRGPHHVRLDSYLYYPLSHSVQRSHISRNS